MIRRLLFAVALTLAAPATFAQGATEATVDRLFTAMRLEAALQSSYAMVDQMMKQTMAQAAPEGTSPQQREAMEATALKFAKMMREEMGWATLRPQMVKMYSETFSEAEVLGIVAFYESPAGQAFVLKMPMLMQKSMAMSQERMRAIMPRFREELEKTMAEGRANRTPQ